MEGDTDTFEELLKLCEDFMQTAIGVNSNFESSSWMHALNDYKDLSKSIMKCRSRQQKAQQGAMLKIQQLQEAAMAEKENASLMKKKVDEEEHEFSDLKLRISNLNNEENCIMEVIDRLKSEFKEAELAFHQLRLSEAVREKNRLLALRELTNGKAIELEERMSALKNLERRHQQSFSEGTVQVVVD